MNGVIQSISIDRIRIDGGTQVRCEISAETVTGYAESIGCGTNFPAIVVFYDGSDYWAADGFHRLLAHNRIGKEAILAEVIRGTVEDARWYALSCNKEHGLPRNNKDKRRAVELALKARPDLSNRAIAAHVGVSDPFVMKIREEVGATANGSQSRTGLDGRTINTANIGSNSSKRDTTQPQQSPPREQSQPTPTPSLLFGASDDDDSEPDGGEAPSLPEPTISSPDVPEPDLSPASESVKDGHYLISSRLGDYVLLNAWKSLPPSEQEEAIACTLPSDKTPRFNDQKDRDGIEWALWSWNPVTGCRHDCPYCYARDIAERFYDQKFEPSLWPDRLAAPKVTPFPADKAREWMGHKNVFTCSMADLFGRWVPREWIEAVLAACRESPQWNFLFLTKFPIRMAEFDFPDNCWVGTTVDCQIRVRNAEQAFRKVKAKVKWLSCEPLIEPLKFEDIGAFDWLVIGGASKSNITPAWLPPRQWVELVERQADDAGVKVYEKPNLWPDGWPDSHRRREYPGMEAASAAIQAPPQLRYLPMVET